MTLVAQLESPAKLECQLPGNQMVGEVIVGKWLHYGVTYMKSRQDRVYKVGMNDTLHLTINSQQTFISLRYISLNWSANFELSLSNQKIGSRSTLSSPTSFKMVRGAEYDNGVPQSDNAIEAGATKAHGTGATVRCNDPNFTTLNAQNTNIITIQDAPIERVNKVAPMPEETGSQREVYSGAGSAGSNSGKGGHEPKTLGENKGRGAKGMK